MRSRTASSKERTSSAEASSDDTLLASNGGVQYRSMLSRPASTTIRCAAGSFRTVASTDVGLGMYEWVR